MFDLEYSNISKKFLKKSDKTLAKRIMDKIEKLQENSVPSDAKFMGRVDNNKVFRIRVGGYRIIYRIKDSEKVILVSRIGKRNEVYD